MKLYAIASLAALLFGSTSTVEATQCRAPPCGRFENDTPWAAKWSDLGLTDHRCQLWNVADPVTCYQYDLGARSSRGGYFNSPRVDVDAICYANRRYYVKWGNDESELGVGAGVWVKIRSDQTARCRERNGAPHCTINPR
ncbi:hypothetical protein ACJ41O_005739 [Fusarium nematophilum]